MGSLIKNSTPDRSKIDTQSARELKYWTKALGVSKDNLVEAIEKVGNAAATVRKELHRKELALLDTDKPLKSDDFRQM